MGFVPDKPARRFSPDPITEPLKIGREGFADSLRSVLDEAGWAQRNIAGAGTAVSNVIQGTKQFAGKADPVQMEADRIMRQEAPVGAFAGDVALTALPFGLAGKSVKAATAVGAGYGAMQPVEGEQTFANIAKGKAINTVVGGASAAGGQVLANKTAGYLTKKAGEIATKKGQNATRDATLETGKRLGLVVPPEQVNPSATNKVLTGFSGKLTTQQAISAKNQEVFNSVARKTLGLPDDVPLTEETLNAFRSAKAAPYAELASISDDAAKAVEELKQARFDSKSYWKFFNRSGDPKARVEAKALDATVEKLEKSLEQIAVKAGKPTLVPDLRQARKDIAKSYVIEKSLNDASGNINARVWAKEKFLTGDLKAAADFAKAFPKSAQSVDMLGSQPGLSPLDFATAGITGGAGAMAAGPQGLFAAGIPLLRPVARAALTSKPYQSLFATPNYGLPLTTRAAGGLLSNAPIGSTVLSLDALGQ